MELGVSHEQSLSSSTPNIDNIFDKYNKKFGTIRSLSDHDKCIKPALLWHSRYQGYFEQNSDLNLSICCPFLLTYEMIVLVSITNVSNWVN